MVFSYKKKVWELVLFKYFLIFDMFVLDLDLKDDIKEDFLEFIWGKEFY